MAQTKLHGRWCTCGAAQHNHSVQIHRVEQAGMRIALGHWRRIGGIEGAQITKARRRNDAKSRIDQRLPEHQALVKTPACAMNDEQRRAATRIGEFDRTARRLGEVTARRDPGFGLGEIASKFKKAVCNQYAGKGGAGRQYRPRRFPAHISQPADG